MTTRLPRLRSLDAFRGLTVAAMILVNNPGDWGNVYAPLLHAHWHGWTPTDLIFPFFLFIVGVSITFALGKDDRPGRFEWSTKDRELVSKIARRGLTLFLLGFFLNLFPRFDFANVRIMGVLQRIGIVYAVCALTYLRYSPRQQVNLVLLILIGYYLLMTFVPVPGVGYANPETNFAAWLDSTILTPAHCYRPAKIWDPEGLLSTVPAIATGLLGLLTGRWLRSTRYGNTVRESQKALFLFLAGAMMALVGTLFDLVFPINKALWTSSYVLLSGGLAMCGLAIFYYLIDVRRSFRWSGVLVAFGVNAITVFFLSGLIPRIFNLIKLKADTGEPLGLKEYLYQIYIAPPFADPKMASLAGAFTLIAIWSAILWVMYRRQIIIKV
jgi:predicted acyltransferase